MLDYAAVLVKVEQRGFFLNEITRDLEVVGADVHEEDVHGDTAAGGTRRRCRAGGWRHDHEQTRPAAVQAGEDGERPGTWTTSDKAGRRAEEISALVR